MDIGVDFTSINPAYGGGTNTYAAGLVSGLARVGAKHRIRLFITPDQAEFVKGRCSCPGVELVVVPDRGRWERLFRAGIARSAYVTSKSLHRVLADAVMKPVARFMDEHADVIYVPTAVLYPYTYQKPTILSMHDLQQVHYPQFFSPWMRKRRRTEYGLSAERATYLQASSEFIRQDLLTHFRHLHPEQVVVIPEGVMIEEFSSPCREDVVAKYRLPSKFLFFPAQLWLHKNHITVLKALHRLQREKAWKIPLVLTGAKSTGAKEILAYIKEQRMDDVYYLGKVPFSDMVALYQRARFFITAVLYESSSLPFLEAAAAGCPVIASNTPPNREMARILNASLFDPLNDRELASLLGRIWEDDTLRRVQIDHNREKVNYYSWDNAARRYLEFIESRISA